MDEAKTAALRMVERAVANCPGIQGKPCRWYKHCAYELDCPTFTAAHIAAHILVDPIGDYRPVKQGSWTDNERVPEVY